MIRTTIKNNPLRNTLVADSKKEFYDFLCFADALDKNKFFKRAEALFKNTKSWPIGGWIPNSFIDWIEPFNEVYNEMPHGQDRGYKW